MKYDEQFLRAIMTAGILTTFAGCTAQQATNPPSEAVSQVGARNSKPFPASTESLIYSFPQQNNWPTSPTGAVALNAPGTIYGTTVDYWESTCGQCGRGTVYSLTTGGSGTLATVLHFFSGGADGYEPQTGITLGPNGALYGTTYYGGNESYVTCPGGGVGCGVLFKLTGSGSTWHFVVLHTFANSSVTNDGDFPSGPPLLVNGVLYGVTNGGGSNSCPNFPGCGSIYKVNVDGSGYSILHDFSGGVMHYPDGSLASDGSGNLYGTAVFGGGGSCDGTNGCGAVFKMKTDGTGFTNIHAFTGVAGHDGAAPESGVTYDSGKVYGTTATGGTTGCVVQGYNASGCGIVFALSQGPSNWSEAILHNFTASNGQAKIPSGLFLASNGLLYGTTGTGGDCGLAKFPGGCGIIFNISTAGSFSTVHSFQGPPNDGAFPFASTPAGPLVMPISPPAAADEGASGSAAAPITDATGAIWGVTAEGGSGNCSGYGCGAVYKLTGADAHPRKSFQKRR